MGDAGTVLIVDDTRVNRAVLARALHKVGYVTCEAEGGLEGIAAAREHAPDLILLDVMMPGCDGFEVCRELKADGTTAAIPVIFVTALTEPEEKVRAFAVGGSDYIVKPFKIAEVLARVNVHVRLRQAQKALRQKNHELEKLAKEMADLSQMDSLTRLTNRRVWLETLAKEHDRFQRHGHRYGLIVIDVDFFKAFNDSLGHLAGDECLRNVASAIRRTCRNSDTVGRYGGEEFVVLAPDTGVETVTLLAERIRKAIWDMAIPHPASACGVRVTASLGVAGASGENWHEVLRRADNAMYVAKRAGRNMVYSDDGGPRPPVSQRAEPSDAAPCATSSGLLTTRVLVVDDEPTNRAVCRGCLQRAGYAVQEAADGEALFQALETELPDLIIMDVMMPEVDGLECTRRLRGDPRTRDIPVIMMSALGKSADILAGLEAGADEYLTKPVRTAELALRVRSMARLRREHRDLLRSYEVRGEHMRMLTRLVEFCRLIGTSSRFQDILDHTVKAAAELTHSRRAAIMLPHTEREILTIVACVGMDAKSARALEVPFGEPVAGKAYQSAYAIIINDAASSDENPSRCDSSFFVNLPLICTPLRASDEVMGVLNVTERIGGTPFEPHELECVELISKLAATAIHGLQTRDARDRAYESVVATLAQIAEYRDCGAGRHLDRVARFCGIIAEGLSETEAYRDTIDETFLHELARATPLHDIGKFAIPDHVLQHPDRLAQHDEELLCTHAAIGATTIQSLIDATPRMQFLKMAADIARYHHEWFDGSGYPAGLAGEAIPLAARIVAVADAYDALTTTHAGAPPMSHDRAVAAILEGSGTQFDPTIVEIFLAREHEIAECAAKLADPPSPATPERVACPVSTES